MATDTQEKVEICGEIKEGFWAVGLFVVLEEDAAYYRDQNNEWRVLRDFSKRRL